MPFLNELVLTVIGGVVTGLILEMFRPRSRHPGGGSGDMGSNPRDTFIGQFVRLILAVLGGVAIAIIGGRILIQSGIAPKGLSTRLLLLVAGTVVCWLLLLVARKR